MKDQKLYGFHLMELEDDYFAFKSGNDEKAEIRLSVNKKFLKECDNPLKEIRHLELIFKKFLKEAQDEEWWNHTWLKQRISSLSGKDWALVQKKPICKVRKSMI